MLGDSLTEQLTCRVTLSLVAVLAHAFVKSNSPSDWSKNRRGSREAESEANAPQSEENDEEQKEEIEQRKPVLKPPFSRRWKRERNIASRNERYRERKGEIGKRKKRRGSREADPEAPIQSEVKATKRKCKQKRLIKRKKSRGSRETKRVPSKARSEAAILSEASATQSEETDETDEEKEKEGREQRSRMWSVESLLLLSRHAVGSENEI
jgi:hypothetical protein